MKKKKDKDINGNDILIGDTVILVNQNGLGADLPAYSYYEVLGCLAGGHEAMIKIGNASINRRPWLNASRFGKVFNKDYKL